MAEAKRKRRWLMWGSAAGLALTLAAAVCLEFYVLSWRELAGGAPNRFLVCNSSVTVIYRPGPDNEEWLGREFFPPGWAVVPAQVASVFVHRWTPEFSRDSNGRWYAQVPLWLPAVLCAAGVWWGRKRGGWRGDGVCRRCGYDVSGLASGVCPECGGAA